MRFPRPARVAALLAAAALAGCMGAEEPADLSAAATPAVATPSAPPPEASAPPAQVAAPEPVATPLAWDGKIEVSACVPSGAATCETVVDGDPSFRQAVPGRGAAQAIDATLTWTPASPATEKLRFALVVESPSPDGQGVVARVVGEPRFGASPLAISEPDLGLDANDTLILHVWEDLPGPPGGAVPAYFHYSVEQAIRIEGSVTRLAPAPEAQA